MGQATTDRPVNPGQLAHELTATFGGPRPLRIIGPRPDGTTTVDAPGTGADRLTAAIGAHTADPMWTDPNPPPAPTLEETRSRRLAELRTHARTRDLTPAEATEAVRLALAAGRL